MRCRERRPARPPERRLSSSRPLTSLPTRMTLITPIAVRSRIVEAVEASAGTRSSSSTTRRGSLASPRIVKYRHRVGRQPHAKEAPERRPDFGWKADQPAERPHDMPAAARQQHQRQQDAQLPRFPQRCLAIDEGSVRPKRARPTRIATREIQVGIDGLIPAGSRESAAPRSRRRARRRRDAHVSDRRRLRESQAMPAATGWQRSRRRHATPASRTRRRRRRDERVHGDASGALPAVLACDVDGKVRDAGVAVARTIL